MKARHLGPKLLALGLPALGAAAQGTGRVSGTLLDAASQEALPYAGVVLLRAADSSFVAGASPRPASTWPPSSWC
ncbi:MAG: hypothetical protein M3Y54_06090 [Bacteroidota bacterium]|nr:hypothetical protein [Bacteroidota bacterium]